MRLFFAFRVFFAVLFRRDAAVQIRELLDEGPAKLGHAEATKPELVEPKPAVKPSAATQTKSTRRNEGLTLLSALQREARLLDLVCESLDQYNDAQIGAAARDVLRDTRKTLDRMFGLRNLVESPEGETIAIPSNPSPVRWRIVGKESGKSGTLSHPGWQATKLDMPQWSGGADDSMVIAAAEVET
ncbi:MAG: DUF2760 domain-containing protein [Planctomycetota bacterium]|nr:DUF2760 domain-containing protein [Planctomycetota bacterium]